MVIRNEYNTEKIWNFKLGTTRRQDEKNGKKIVVWINIYFPVMNLPYIIVYIQFKNFHRSFKFNYEYMCMKHKV